ncbi:tetratricopeptide repeat protein [[Mycobacterium] vasticus]|uniref:Tetratricopeptide repeat protein n=1 Tax=[Mycobacterium] vasticus TaxID=2875777 RepID=A0ABU5Z2M8_9MYCO|nr:tetratricopeptide repeat protein [Mycolicibacter sp. MYC017]MEB3071664.1 tetratricopeptide repeat protein [Mycolicibacter sp. MYC017]
MADDATAPAERMIMPGRENDGADSTIEDIGATAGAESAAAPSDHIVSGPEDGVVIEASETDIEALAEGRARRRLSPLALAVLLGIGVAVGVGCLAGWSGLQAYQARQTERQHEVFLQVARQGALNLTTIDWEQADADVERILNGATGTFHDDFSSRVGPFLEVVKHAQSKSVGTITGAGLESETADEAQALVAVNVTTDMAGVSTSEPRAWRMRIAVQKVGDEIKVSNVQFVP